MSYDKKAPRVRVAKEFNDYVGEVSRETGLSKVKVTKFLAKDLKNSELKVLKRRRGVCFDFKI